MSMEIYAFSDRRLISMGDWQKAIVKEGFSLRLDGSRPFLEIGGHLPATWQSKPAGFECDHWRPEDILDGYIDVKFGRRWKYCLAFRWGADVRACLGAYMAACGYARATEGVVFDPQDGVVMTAQQAYDATAKIEKGLPVFERQMETIVAGIESRSRPRM